MTQTPPTDQNYRRYTRITELCVDTLTGIKDQTLIDKVNGIWNVAYEGMGASRETTTPTADDVINAAIAMREAEEKYHDIDSDTDATREDFIAATNAWNNATLIFDRLAAEYKRNQGK